MSPIVCNRCDGLEGVAAYRLTITQGTPPGVLAQPIELCVHCVGTVTDHARRMAPYTGGLVVATLEPRP